MKIKIIEELEDIFGGKRPNLVVDIPSYELLRCRTIKAHEELIEKYLIKHIKENTEYKIIDY